MAGLKECLDDSIRQRMLRPALLNEQRPTAPVKLAGTSFVGLGPDEVGQELLIGPAGCSTCGPSVVVGPVAAHVDHRVYRRAPAQDLALSDVEAPTFEGRLGFRRVVPVDVRLE